MCKTIGKDAKWAIKPRYSWLQVHPPTTFFEYQPRIQEFLQERTQRKGHAGCRFRFLHCFLSHVTAVVSVQVWQLEETVVLVGGVGWGVNHNNDNDNKHWKLYFTLPHVALAIWYLTKKVRRTPTVQLNYPSWGVVVKNHKISFVSWSGGGIALRACPLHLPRRNIPQEVSS